MTASGIGWAAATLLLAPLTSRALPSFARQIDLQCTACHTAYPTLNQFGRQFKLSGYTSSADKSDLLPLAIMLQPSFTHTDKGQAGGAAPGFGDNNNWALTQLSFFYAGRLFGPFAQSLFGADTAAFLNKFGLFAQVTYDGVGKAWSWDNTELRFANVGTLGGQDATYGFYLNNNPTLQDPWNSAPAWGYPFTGSGLAPTPAAATLIDGALAGQVCGFGAYVMLNDSWYIDLGGYRTIGAHFQKTLGVDPSGETQVTGLAPYWRVAVDKPVGAGRLEFGLFGLAADTYPGRDSSAGKDRFLDFGVDSQYQLSAKRSDFAAQLTWISERSTWHASQALGNTENDSGTLQTFKLTGHYLFDKTYGFTAQYFVISGRSDATLYAGSATGSPSSSGFILQADYLPFNKLGGPKVWPRSNVKFSLQYTSYLRFDGARTNYDGAGANARDNNTLYAEAWIVF